jgi:hypothetical protein
MHNPSTESIWNCTPINLQSLSEFIKEFFLENKQNVILGHLSFMKICNKMGFKIEPCGTTESVGRDEETSLQVSKQTSKGNPG